MKQNLSAGFIGLLFALGLGLSGMTDPKKVIGFLNILGDWDPTLMFVMLGAVGVHFVLYRWIRKRKTPVLDSSWHLPSHTKINAKLVVGAVIFGMGWGLAGYCPGPALTSLASLKAEPALFVLGMIAGMGIFNFLFAGDRFRFRL